MNENTIGNTIADLWDSSIGANLGTDHTTIVVQLSDRGGNGIPWFGGMHCTDIETYPSLANALAACDPFATERGQAAGTEADLQRNTVRIMRMWEAR